MRLTHFAASSLPVLLLPSVAGAKFSRPTKGAGGSKKPKNDILDRQFPVRRGPVDACIAVRGDVFADVVGLVNAPLHSDLQVSLCQSEIDVWLATDSDGIQLSSLIGVDAAKENLRFLVCLYSSIS
ncbi:hypothetical protein H0H87_010847 [Tephrocybe sp. NHM501043]|nr:hypothetical protein H0H87_010847 [Tephrocybe sp. NHM501043]